MREFTADLEDVDLYTADGYWYAQAPSVSIEAETDGSIWWITEINVIGQNRDGGLRIVSTMKQNDPAFPKIEAEIIRLHGHAIDSRALSASADMQPEARPLRTVRELI